MSDSAEICPQTVESAELILKNISILGELSHLLKKTRNGENSINSLNNLVYQAGKDISSIHKSVNTVIAIAEKLVHLSLQMVPTNNPNYKSLKREADSLLNVLCDIKDKEEERHEMMWKGQEKCKGNFKCNDDKYPERCSRESLLDISNVVNLPTVPEDAFASFQRPNRTLSSCSLKNLRKVQLCLQKATCSDMEEEFDHTDSNISSPKKDLAHVHAITQTSGNSNLMSTSRDACTATE
ncbi:uncharacterized protein LOC128985698 isoform X2 [Macrosteles quadrilineatus]|uniref:uncharacterized protein LOC128985698 isoform X2 n=1 Tax=Macrosteles quadrilineatus TaxID=74068 RepID=UPI0023E20228|nr:uncharacterized protein LOC128985698 isoform X2 [Macrosteles quadrilineatus]